jgi:hypothetical protein
MTNEPTEDQKRQTVAVNDQMIRCFHEVVRPSANKSVRDLGGGENEIMLALWVAPHASSLRQRHRNQDLAGFLGPVMA